MSSPHNCIGMALLFLGLVVSINVKAQNLEPGSVEYKEMTVHWEEVDGRIHFELKAPTEGWVTIGFDDDDSIDARI
jgi:hypothetical protein